MKGRSDSRGTYVLLGLAVVVFVSSLTVAVTRIFAIERDVGVSVGENLVWSLAQNEIEMLRLIDSLRDYGETRADSDDVQLRFDVVWSRFALFQEGEMALRLASIPGARVPVDTAREGLAAVEAAVATLAQGDREGAGEIVARLSPLLPGLRRVTVQVAQSELDRLAARNTMRRNALWTALASLGGLVIALVLLVGVLLRENRQRKRLAREAQEAERLAQDSEARFRDIVEAASDWVWETDAEHRLTFISDRLRQLSGEEPSEVIGKTRFDLRLPGDQDPAWEYHRQILSRRQPFRDFEFVYLNADGERSWARIHGRPCFDAAGRFLGYRGTGRDVTAERADRRALKQSRALLRAVIDAVPAIVNVKDSASRYVVMNRFQGEVYGVDPAAAVGQQSSDFTGEAYGARSRALDRHVFATGQALPFAERDFVDTNGKKRTWWTAKAPIKNSDDTVSHVVTVALDISDLKAERRARSNLSRYVSPNLVDLLSARDQPIGDVRRQDVAVVFTDLFDFTSHAARETPERIMGLLRDLHARMADLVLSHGGTLEKFLGDGLMATFGTPNRCPRDAVNALACVRSMALAMAEWNAARRKSGEAEMRIGIGGHWGPVILGEIGTEARVEFAVVGDTVNVASRLEYLTRELRAPAVVSEELMAAARAEGGLSAEALADFHAAGLKSIDGHDRPFEIWVLDVESLAAARARPLAATTLQPT